MAKYYTVNPNTKKITIDDSVKATKQDEEDIARYMKFAGYTIRHKSKRRAEASANRATSLKDADIVKALEGKPELEEYKRIKATKGEGGGFFAAKTYYLKWKDSQKKK